jgi:SHS2 domain-containing protein
MENLGQNPREAIQGRRAILAEEHPILSIVLEKHRTRLKASFRKVEALTVNGLQRKLMSETDSKPPHGRTMKPILDG